MEYRPVRNTQQDPVLKEKEYLDEAQEVSLSITDSQAAYVRGVTQNPSK